MRKLLVVVILCSGVFAFCFLTQNKVAMAPKGSVGNNIEEVDISYYENVLKEEQSKSEISEDIFDNYFLSVADYERVKESSSFFDNSLYIAMEEVENEKNNKVNTSVVPQVVNDPVEPISPGNIGDMGGGRDSDFDRGDLLENTPTPQTTPTPRPTGSVDVGDISEPEIIETTLDPNLGSNETPTPEPTQNVASKDSDIVYDPVGEFEEVGFEDFLNY